MNKLLTIVIPAYNMEKYLKRCLDSILCEDIMEKVEVFIINDGSKDRTLEIAKEYENRYPNYYHAIDKPNGNYGSCMNKGLSLAKGKYFRTLDADDWFDTPSFLKYLKELEKTDADMLISEYVYFYEDTQSTEIVKITDECKKNVDLPFIKKNWNNSCFLRLSKIWGLVYKTSLLKESGIKWDEGVFYTDNEFDFWPLKLVKTIRYIPIPVYIYLIGREGQSVNDKVQERNYNSYNIVANTMVDEFLKVYDENSEVFPVQLHFLNRVLNKLYIRLLSFNFKHDDVINNMNEKLMTNPKIYKFFSDISQFHGIHYIEAFRNNKLLLFYCKCRFSFDKFIYSLVTNKTIRRLLGKK